MKHQQVLISKSSCCQEELLSSANQELFYTFNFGRFECQTIQFTTHPTAPPNRQKKITPLKEIDTLGVMIIIPSWSSKHLFKVLSVFIFREAKTWLIDTQMIQRLRNVSGTPTNTSVQKKTHPTRRLSWGVINAFMSTNTRGYKELVTLQK